MPSDAQPHADEVGCPDDGHGQATPVEFAAVAIARAAAITPREAQEVASRAVKQFNLTEPTKGDQ